MSETAHAVPTASRTPDPAVAAGLPQGMVSAAAPSPPANIETPRSPPPVRTGPGYRENGQLKVWEWAAGKLETIYGTMAYWTLLSYDTSTFVLSKILDIPPMLLGLYVWGEHKLTESARRTIRFWAAMLFLIAGIDWYAWDCTLEYATGPVPAAGVSFILAGMSLLLERSFLIVDLTSGPTFALKAWPKRLITALAVTIMLRILVLLIIAIANGEAMKIQLARDEIEHQSALQSQEIAQRLRNARENEIKDEITRRGNEARTAHQASLHAWDEDRRTGRDNLVRQRAAGLQTRVDEAERRHDAVLTEEVGQGASARPGHGDNARARTAEHGAAVTRRDGYEQETNELVRKFDETTDEGRRTRENALNAQLASLASEKDSRLAATRATSVEQLGQESGTTTRVPRGMWARRDLLEEVHKHSASSRHGDWFASILLIGIGLMPLIMKRTGNTDVWAYFSLKMHAWTDDGTEWFKRAREVYEDVLRNDPSVPLFYQEWFGACHRLAEARLQGDAKIGKAAREMTAGFHLDRGLLEERIGRIRLGQPEHAPTTVIAPEVPATGFRKLFKTVARWFSRPAPRQAPGGLVGALLEVEGLALIGRNAGCGTFDNLPALAWPASCGPDPREQPLTMTDAELAARGYVPPEVERAERTAWAEARNEAERALMEAVASFHERFPAINAETFAAARAAFYRTLTPAILVLGEIEARFASVPVSSPAWLGESDPRHAAREIENAIRQQAIIARNQPEPAAGPAAGSGQQPPTPPAEAGTPLQGQAPDANESGIPRLDTRPGPRGAGRGERPPYLRIVREPPAPPTDAS